MRDDLPPIDRARRSSADYEFPFPAAGRPRRAAAGRLPSRSDSRWPFERVAEPAGAALSQRTIRSRLDAAAFKARVAEFADDVGIVSIDDPALAHERDEILWVYPDARSLVCLIGRENPAALQSRYLPSANHELYRTEERVHEMGSRTLRLVESLGGAGLTTTIGWPQEVSQRWADKIWPLSHKLVAQAAGLGVIGLSRNFLHREFGAYCLIDTVITNLVFDPAPIDAPIAWNPCLNCNLCVAGCPTEAIRSDGDFDFFACYNHTYRDSIPGFMDLVRDLSAARPRRFARRWSDAEIAALWQSLAFRVEYRCFNCVSVCPANDLENFHGSRAGRREVVDRQLRPLTRSRAEQEAQFVIDTPGARDRHDIPPGRWRSQPGRDGSPPVRLVELARIRTSKVDAMMRNMPHYFRDSEASGVEFRCRMELLGEGGGVWSIRVQGGRCQVHPVDDLAAEAAEADLRVRCRADLFLAIHRGEASALWALVCGRIRLHGRRRLFLLFPRLFAATPGATPAHRWLWQLRRAWKRTRPRPPTRR